jgi:hypothetical protein
MAKIPSVQEAARMFGEIPIQDLKGGPRCCFTSCTRCKCGSALSAENVLDS